MARVVFLIQREDIDPSRAVQPKILFPIESAFAGALLKDAGHNIRAFDLNLMWDKGAWQDDFRSLLSGFAPDFIVSAPQMLTFLIRENRGDTKAAFDMARGLNGGIKTVYCGPFATSYPDRAFEETGADYLIRGEYDRPLLGLIEGASSGGGTGVISSGRSTNGTAPVFTEDLDSLPFPAYEEFGYREYFKHPGKGNLRYAEHSRSYTHYQTSRGCPCRCCFCNVSFLRGGRKWRFRSVQTVLGDIRRLIEDYGIEEIHFLDENLTINKRRTIELCEGIVERKLDFKWIASGGLSIYSLDDNALHAMRGAGCYRLNLAFESGSQAVLDGIIKKPVKLKRDIEKLEVARKLGFEMIGYFVIGLPGESRSQIRETLELAASPYFDYVTISIATPQAGTRLEKECHEKGLIAEGAVLADISRRSTGVFSTGEFSLYDLEEIRWKEWDRINFSTPEKRGKACRIMGISEGELEKLREETERNFRKSWAEKTG